MMDGESVTSSSPSKPWSETRRGRFVIIVGVIGLFVLVFWMAMRSRRMLAPKSALVVDEQYLNFGEVWEDPAFVWGLPIRNTSNHDVEIAGFETSCTCGKIEPSSLTVPAQETAEVRLTLNLLSRYDEPDLTGRDFKVAIQPRIAKRSGAQVGWVVQGKVKQPFAVAPTMVDFEESLIRGQSFAPRSVFVTCALDVVEMTTHCDSPFFTAKVLHDEKNPRGRCLEIQPGKDLPGGRFKQVVRIGAILPSKKVVSRMIAVKGCVLEEVQAVPTTVVFGGCVLGRVVEETVILQSRAKESFEIQAIEIPPKRGITVAQLVGDTTYMKRFQIKQQILSRENQFHTVRFLIGTKKGRKYSVSLDISYLGLEREGE